MRFNFQITILSKNIYYTYIIKMSYYERHKEICKIRSMEYYQKHRDEYLEYQREYFKAYYQMNKKKIKQKIK